MNSLRLCSLGTRLGRYPHENQFFSRKASEELRQIVRARKDVLELIDKLKDNKSGQDGIYPRALKELKQARLLGGVTVAVASSEEVASSSPPSLHSIPRLPALPPPSLAHYFHPSRFFGLFFLLPLQFAWYTA